MQLVYANPGFSKVASSCFGGKRILQGGLDQTREMVGLKRVSSNSTTILLTRLWWQLQTQQMSIGILTSYHLFIFHQGKNYGKVCLLVRV